MREKRQSAVQQDEGVQRHHQYAHQPQDPGTSQQEAVKRRQELEGGLQPLEILAGILSHLTLVERPHHVAAQKIEVRHFGGQRSRVLGDIECDIDVLG